MDEKINFNFNIITPDFAFNLIYYGLNSKNEKTIFLLKKIYDIELLKKTEIPGFEYKNELNKIITLRLQGFSKEAIKEKLLLQENNPILQILEKNFNKIEENIFDTILQDKIEQFYTSTFVQQLFTNIVENNNPDIVLKKIKYQVKKYSTDTDFNSSFKEFVFSDENNFDNLLQPTDVKHIDPIFPSFKKIFPSGFETQRLYIIGGSTGRGKSVLLHNIATKLWSNNYNIYHFTLENSLEETQNRYLSLMTETNLSDLQENRDEVILKAKKFVENKTGQLLIKEYPAGLLSKSDIIEYIKLKQAEKNILPDIIIVDYLDLMTTYEKFNEIRFKLTQIANDLKQIAQLFNCVVITATQLNRDAIRATTANESNIAEAYSKIFIADAFLTLNATEEEIKKQLLRIFVAKNRIGESRLEFLFKTDFAKAMVEDLNITVDENYLKNIKSNNNENDEDIKLDL